VRKIKKRPVSKLKTTKVSDDNCTVGTLDLT